MILLADRGVQECPAGTNVVVYPKPEVASTESSSNTQTSSALRRSSPMPTTTSAATYAAEVRALNAETVSIIRHSTHATIT